MTVTDYLLRVSTSKGTLRLPLTDTQQGKFIFNWIVHEEPVEVYWTQLVAEYIPNADEECEVKLIEIEKRQGDGMFLDAFEVACWTRRAID